MFLRGRAKVQWKVLKSGESSEKTYLILKSIIITLILGGMGKFNFRVD